MGGMVYNVYVRLDEKNVIIDINSSAFLSNTEGWVQIDSGYDDRYHHAQGNYLGKTLTDERGVYRFKLVDGAAVERTDDEMDADCVETDTEPDLVSQVAELRESNHQLQEAFNLLLSGEVV